MTKPIFALQITDRDDYELKRTAKALDEAGCDWINFGIIHFSHEITNLEAFPTDRPVIPLAGTIAIDLYRRKKLPPNWTVYYEPRLFDQCYTRLGGIHTLMFNRKARIFSFENCKDHRWDHDVFVKPSNDLKVFAGTVLPAGQSLNEMLEKITHNPIQRGEQIVHAHVRPTGGEYRLFIVNNQIVDGSEYKRDGRVGHKVISTQTAFDLDRFFHSMRYLTFGKYGHPPPLAYCMDVVEVYDNPNSEFEIMEFNCFHACGMYETDRMLVFSELQAAIEGQQLRTNHG